MRASDPATDSAGPSSWPWRWMVLALVVAAIGVLAWLFHDLLDLDYLAEREAALREYQQVHPALVLVAAFLLYVTVTGLSIPGAAVLSLTFAWYFGFWRALVLISFASTGGATIAFLFSRYLLRDWVQQRFGDRLVAFNRNLDREGSFYLFTLRLIPVVPFFVINLVMGLTRMRASTFWWISQLGMLPGTAAYVWAGASVPTLGELAERGVGGVISWQLFAAFAVLGLFPLTVRRIMQWIRGPLPDRDETSAGT